MNFEKKICLVTSSYPVKAEIGLGGVASFERDYALCLARKGFKVHVFCPFQNGVDFNDDAIEVHRFRWYRCNEDIELASLKLSRIKDLLSLISVIIKGSYFFIKLSKREKFDFNFCFWAVPAGFWALIIKIFFKTRFSVWTLGSDIWVYGRNWKTKWILKLILSKADFIYSDGYDLLKETEMLANKKGLFMPSTRDLKNVNSKAFYNFDPSKMNFLFVGRYHINKGPDILLEAIFRLGENVQNMAFHFFGGGDLLNDLLDFISEKNIKNTFINGFVGEEEIKFLLENSDFLIIPSREDSIPVILSDACQFSLPVIAADVGDTGRLVQEFQIGIVVKSEDPEELSKAIIKAYQNIEIDKYSFEKFREIFQIDKAVDRFITDYN